MAHTIQITFDARDAAGLGRFWALALGYVEQPPPEGFSSWTEFADANDIEPEARDGIYAIVDPAGVGPRVLFLAVPESKTSKNRVHIDVVAPDGDRAGHVARLVGLGAVHVRDVDDEPKSWSVMTDPEGNEFCVLD